MSAYGNPRVGAVLRAARARRPAAGRWLGGNGGPGDLGPGALSLVALAAATGYDATMLGRIEAGERLPSLAGLARLAAALDLDDREIAALVRAAGVGEHGPHDPHETRGATQRAGDDA